MLKNITGPASQSVINTNLLNGMVNIWQEVKDIKSASVQILASAGISAGAIIFEQTNEPTNVNAVVAVPVFETSTVGAAITGAITIAASTGRSFELGITAKYFRIRISTAFVGGTVQAIASFSNAAPTRNMQTSTLFGSSSVIGPAAHDAVASAAPNRIAGRAVSANYAAVASGDVADVITTLIGAQIVKPFSIPEGDWAYAAASGGIVNTTDVVLAAAAGAGLKRYLTSIQIRNSHATVATEVVIKDGSTVIWRGHYPALSVPDSIVFTSPLKSTANAALNAACITTGSAVYVNAQGYTAP